jgi:hypothetical protein
MFENALGIDHKPMRKAGDSDVAVVSDEAGGQNNRWRSQGPLAGRVASETVSAAGRKSDYGVNAHRGDRDRCSV